MLILSKKRDIFEKDDDDLIPLIKNYLVKYLEDQIKLLRVGLDCIFLKLDYLSKEIEILKE